MVVSFTVDGGYLMGGRKNETGWSEDDDERRRVKVNGERRQRKLFYMVVRFYGVGFRGFTVYTSEKE